MHTTIPTEQALQMLKDGSRRFVQGQPAHPRQSASRRSELLAGQHPFAIVLSCSDSRVPPEVLFDQGLGDLFVIRNAGNIVDDVVLGSIEQAVETTGVGLVLVLGHSQCMAVTAAVQGGIASGNIARIVDAIRPVVLSLRHTSGDRIHEAVLANIHQSVEKIRSSWPVLSEAVQQGHLLVTGAMYHLDSGEVEFLQVPA